MPLIKNPGQQNSVCVYFLGNGADAALQPAIDRGTEEQTNSRKGSPAQDPTQRWQDSHGHV